MGDSDVGKLFVGGISRETTENALRDHFSHYGDVSFSTIAKDRLTGLPRGFGFVSFSDPSSVDKALKDQHFLAGRTVEVKRAIPRNEQQTISQRQQQQQEQQQIYQGSKGWGRNSNGSYGSHYGDQHIRTKKIFVGGLSANLTEEEFRSYFEKFGRITDVVVMHDNNTNRPRGFGFITFDSEDVVESIVRKSPHELAGKHVDVKKAIPREAAKNFNNGNNFGRGRFSPAAGYTEENHWVRGPRPGQAPVSTAYPGYYYGGFYGGGAYPFGAYGAYGYGMPMVAPRGPWTNGFSMMGFRPFAYGTGYYPTGVNGGVAMMGMVNPYNSMVEPVMNGKPERDAGSYRQATGEDAVARVGGRSDANVSSLKGAEGAANVKKSSRSADAQA